MIRASDAVVGIFRDVTWSNRLGDWLLVEIAAHRIVNAGFIGGVGTQD